jgi:hypothetical protein
MGYSADLMPFIGEIPSRPGQMIMAGFTGHGMPQILLSARGIIQMLRHGKKFSETGVPSIFQVTEERLRDTENEILAGHIRDFPPSKL